MAGDALDVTAFLTGRDGKKRPIRIGRIIMKSLDKGSLYLDAVPVGWDGSATIEVRQERDGGQRGGGYQPRPGPSDPDPF